MGSSGVGHPQGWRKAQVLRALRERGPLGTSEVADATGMTLSHTRNVLRRLRGRHRITTEKHELRPRSGQPEDQHRLADRGEEYLEWWEGQGRDLPDLR